MILIVFGALVTIPKELVKGPKDLEISGDHRNYSIITIGQNTEKSPEDLKRFAGAQTPAENHQLTLVWKTLKVIIIIIIIVTITIIIVVAVSLVARFSRQR